MRIDQPLNVVGAGPMISPGFPVARPCPKAKAKEPGAMAVTLWLAAETMDGTFFIVVALAAGVSDTPRNTSQRKQSSAL